VGGRGGGSVGCEGEAEEGGGGGGGLGWFGLVCRRGKRVSEGEEGV